MMTGEMIKLHVGPPPHPPFFHLYQLLIPSLHDEYGFISVLSISVKAPLIIVDSQSSMFTHASVTLNFLTCGAAFRSNHSTA